MSDDNFTGKIRENKQNKDLDLDDPLSLLRSRSSQSKTSSKSGFSSQTPGLKAEMEDKKDLITIKREYFDLLKKFPAQHRLLKKENEQLFFEKETLRDRIATLKKLLDDKNYEILVLEEEISKLKEQERIKELEKALGITNAEVSKLKGAFNVLFDILKPGLSESHLNASQLQGLLSDTTSEEVQPLTSNQEPYTDIKNTSSSLTFPGERYQELTIIYGQKYKDLLNFKANYLADFIMKLAELHLEEKNKFGEHRTPNFRSLKETLHTWYNITVIPAYLKHKTNVTYEQDEEESEEINQIKEIIFSFINVTQLTGRQDYLVAITDHGLGLVEYYDLFCHSESLKRRLRQCLRSMKNLQLAVEILGYFIKTDNIALPNTKLSWNNFSLKYESILPIKKELIEIGILEYTEIEGNKSKIRLKNYDVAREILREKGFIQNGIGNF